jgi:hypothetical protein
MTRLLPTVVRMGSLGPYRPKVLRKFIGECGNIRHGQGEGACRGKPQEPVSSERMHRESPSTALAQDNLGPEEILAHLFKYKLWQLPHFSKFI